MKSRIVTPLSVLAAVACLGSLIYAISSYQVPADPKRVKFDVEASVLPDDAPGPLAEGESFDINIADMLPLLSEQTPDERREQVADWTAYGVLGRQGADPERVSHWAISHPPVRIPEYAVTAEYSYGPGRAYIAEDGHAWLIYAKGEPRVRTLADLADRLRSELGETPPAFEIFRYEADLAKAQIAVTREMGISAEEMFGSAFGYVSARITQSADLAAFLKQTHNLSYVGQSSLGAVLGGRSFPNAPLDGATLDDVAVLYQAHAEIKRAYAALSSELGQRLAEQSVGGKFDLAVDSFNQWVNAHNGGRSTTAARQAFTRSAQKLHGALTAQGQQAAPVPFFGSASSRTVRDLLYPDGKLKLGEGNQVNLGGKFDGLLDQPLSAEGKLAALDMAQNWMEEMRPYLAVFDNNTREIEAAFWQDAYAEGRVPPGEPGFSLDPQWDGRGLVADLRAARANLNGFIARAEQELGSEIGSPLAPRLLDGRVAQVRDSQFEEAARAADMDRLDAQLDDLIAAVDTGDGTSAEDAALLPFYQLREELTDPARDFTAEDVVLMSLLNLVEGRNRVQCARYDGALKGTAVGMNLFYTDVLAKIWAGLNFGGKAPVTAVPGFRHLPGVDELLEPIYFAEQERLPGTRLWFGQRPSAIRHSKDGKLWFQPNATRIYAAGNNPLFPGEESAASEASLRVFQWWDAHYQEVADYEPAYHRQNQIMKWSIVTGLLADDDQMAWLDDIPTTTDLRFNQWYAAADELKFREDIYLLPEEKWIGDPRNECMEVLSSYSYFTPRGLGGYSGGVSLGSGRALTAANTVKPNVPSNLRRAVAGTESVGKFTGYRKSRISVGGTTDGVKRVSLAPDTTGTLRAGGTVQKPAPLIVDVSSSPQGMSLRAAKGKQPVIDLNLRLTTDGTVVQTSELLPGYLLRQASTRVSKEIKSLAADFNKFNATDFIDNVAVMPGFQPSRGFAFFEAPNGTIRIFNHVSLKTARGPPRFETKFEISVEKLALKQIEMDLAAQTVRAEVSGASKVQTMNGQFMVNEIASPPPRALLDAVGSARYQTIRVTRDPRSGDYRIMRTFTQTPPQALEGGQVARLQSGSKALPELEVVLRGDTIVIDQQVLSTTKPQVQQALLDIAVQIEQGPGAFFEQIATGVAKIGPVTRNAPAITEDILLVASAARQRKFSAVADLFRKAKAEGRLDETVGQFQEAVARDIVHHARLGSDTGFLRAASRRPALSQRPNVALARDIADFKSAPGRSDALRAAARKIEETPEALAGSGGSGGGNITTGKVFGFAGEPPRRPGGSSSSWRIGPEALEMNGYRPLHLWVKESGLPQKAVSATTRDRLAYRVSTSHRDTLLLVEKELLESGSNLPSTQARAFVELSGVLPESHAGSALRGVRPDEVRLIVDGGQSPLRLADGVRLRDGDALLTVQLTGAVLPPPGGGMPVTGSESGSDSGADAQALLTVVLADCDLDGDGYAGREEEDDCVEDALFYEPVSGDFVPYDSLP